MPQLDISTYYSQIFWLLVSFVLLYIFVRAYFIPRVKEVVDMRADHIDQKLLEAENIVAEHKEIRDKISDMLLESRQEGEKIRSGAKKQASDIVAQTVEQADTKLLKKLDTEVDKLDDIKKKVSGDIVEIAPQIGEEIFQHITKFYNLEKKEVN